VTPIKNTIKVVNNFIRYQFENRGRMYKNAKHILRKTSDRIIIPPITKQSPSA